MHRTVVWTCLIVLTFAITGCTGDAQEPDEFADIWLESFADGDYEAYRGSLAADAVFTDPLGDSYLFFDDHPWVSGYWGVKDFDGDGSVSFADLYQAKLALVGVDPLSVEWECVTMTQDQAECTVTTVDAFVDAAGGPPVATVWRLTFEGDQIVVLGLVGPVDSVAAEEASEARASGIRTYAQWVQDRYPDRYDTMFNGPCCSSLMIGLPDIAAQHVDLMTEYFEGTG